MERVIVEPLSTHSLNRVRYQFWLNASDTSNSYHNYHNYKSVALYKIELHKYILISIEESGQHCGLQAVSGWVINGPGLIKYFSSLNGFNLTLGRIHI